MPRELPTPIPPSYEAATKELRRLFLESVNLHLRSDVPLGTALSGGIDSSVIASCVERIAGRETGLQSFSYIAAGSPLSEEKWVDIVAREKGLVQHKVFVDPDEIWEDLDNLIRVQGEPFGSTSIYAQYRVFKRAKEAGITVMLDGQGGDEIFGGYRHYLGARLLSLVKQGKFVELVNYLYHLQNQVGRDTIQSVLWALNIAIPLRYQHIFRRALGKDIFPRWFNQSWLNQNNISRESIYFSRSRDVMKEVLEKDLSSYLIPHLLRYEDRNSMAFSIESRVPFLNPQNCSLCLWTSRVLSRVATGPKQIPFARFHARYCPRCHSRQKG